MIALRRWTQGALWWSLDRLVTLPVALPLIVLALSGLAFALNTFLFRNRVYSVEWYDLTFAGVCLLPPALAHMLAVVSGSRSPLWWLLWLPGVTLYWLRPWYGADGWVLIPFTAAYVWNHVETLFRAGWHGYTPSTHALASLTGVSLVFAGATAMIVRPWFGLVDWSRRRGSAATRTRAGAGRAEGLPQARWASAREVNAGFSHPGGIVLGELTDPIDATPDFDPVRPRTWRRQGKGALITMDPARGNGHVVVIAASAGGKTAGVVIPNILHYDGPLVVIDPKGDLYARTRAAREAKGYKARVIDSEHGFDPFKLIAPLAPASPSVYLTMARTLMPIQSRASDISEYFHEMSCSLFAALMAHFIERKSENVAGDISTFINRTRDDVIEDAQVIALEHNIPLINDEMEGLAALDERTFPGVVKAISNKLAFVRFPDVAKYGTSVQSPEDHLAALDPDTDIFINVPTLASKDFSSFPRLLIGAMYVASELLEQPDRPRARRLFVIDEARVLGGMDALTHVRDAGRSIGLHLMLIYQSLGQLKEAWGGEAGADAWMDSCEARVVGAVGASRTANDIVNMLGRRTLTTRTHGSSSSNPVMAPMGGSVTSSEQEQMREVPLMSAATLGQLPAHGSVIFTRRSKPILATKALYFTRPDMQNRVLSPDDVTDDLEATKRRAKVMEGIAAKNEDAGANTDTGGTTPDEGSGGGQGPDDETVDLQTQALPAPNEEDTNTANDDSERSQEDSNSSDAADAPTDTVTPQVAAPVCKDDPASDQPHTPPVIRPPETAPVVTPEAVALPQQPGDTGGDLHRKIVTMAGNNPAVLEAVLETLQRGERDVAPQDTPATPRAQDGAGVSHIDPAMIDIDEGEERPDITQALDRKAAVKQHQEAIATASIDTPEPDAGDDSGPEPDNAGLNMFDANQSETDPAPEGPDDSAQEQPTRHLDQSRADTPASTETVKPVADAEIPGQSSADDSEGDPAPETPAPSDSATLSDAPQSADHPDPAHNQDQDASNTPLKAQQVPEDATTITENPETSPSEAPSDATHAQADAAPSDEPVSAMDNVGETPAPEDFLPDDSPSPGKSSTVGNAPDAPPSSPKPARSSRARKEDRPARFNAEDIRPALDPFAEDLFRTVFGEPVHPAAADWRLKGQTHISMKRSGGKRGCWYNHKTGAGGDLLDLVALHFCNLSTARDDFQQVLAAAADYAGFNPTEHRRDAEARKAAKAARRDAEAREAREREALTLTLCQCAEEALGTPAETYLASRAIQSWPEGSLGWLPPLTDTIPEDLLKTVYSPEHDALVVWAVDEAGAVTGGQRILVTSQGNRADVEVSKPSFGQISGSVARFAAREPAEGAQASRPLVIAEGPESALSIWQATGHETWAVFGVSGWRHAPIPTDRPVILAPDRDAPDSPAGRAFCKALAHHLGRGCDLKVAVASEAAGSKRDLNDTLQKQGPEAVVAAIAAAHTPGPEDLPEDDQ